MRIYKSKNPYYRSFFILAAARIILCVLPVFLLVFFLWRSGYENYLEIMGFAVVLGGIVVAYALLSRHYRILLSGHRGERALFKILQSIRKSENDTVFLNLPVEFKGSRSEIDLLLVGERGIIIVEVKNHSGAITGGEGDDFWLQRGKKMLNPLIQLRRQRKILKSILRAHGFDVWVENVLFFSNPGVRLSLRLGDSVRAFSNAGELVRFINALKPEFPLTKRECTEVVNIVRRFNLNED
jgi:hypothetical protein